MNKLQVRCPLTYALSRFDGKWKPLILWNVKDAPARFGELRRTVPDASLKMLTQHLKELEADGMLKRTVFPEIPPRVEYQLTALGQSFIPVIKTILRWGEAHYQARHAPGKTVKKNRFRGRWRCE